MDKSALVLTKKLGVRISPRVPKYTPIVQRTGHEIADFVIGVQVVSGILSTLDKDKVKWYNPIVSQG